MFHYELNRVIRISEYTHRLKR